MKRAGSIALVVGGALFLLVVLWGWWRGNRTKTWPSTEGKVVSLTYEKRFSPLKRRHRGSVRHQPYWAVITYSYDVDGMRFVSDHYALGWLGVPRHLEGSEYYLDEVLKVKEQYGTGKTIKVYHHPEKREQSLLLRGYQGFVPTYLLVALAAMGYGGYMLYKD